MPQRLSLCVLRRYRQDYETLFHVVILSKHHHPLDQGEGAARYEAVYKIIKNYAAIGKSCGLHN
jgi:hypothetical protein